MYKPEQRGSEAEVRDHRYGGYRARNEDGGGDTYGGVKRHRTFPIGVKALAELLEKQPFIIARNLISDRSGYEILISEENIYPQKFDMVLKLLATAVQCKTDSEATLQLLLITFQKPQFVVQLMDYVSGLKVHLEKAKEYLPYIIKIIERFAYVAPTEAALKVSALIDLCEIVLLHLNRRGAGEFSVLETTVHSVQSILADSQTKWKNNQMKINSKLDKLDSLSPPDDFRKLTIIPSCEELLQFKEPFLRRIIAEGQYSDSDHYLDVHFRLMKEDFVRPLREGLNNHLHDCGVKNHDVRVYRNAYLCDAKVEEKGLVYYVELSLPKYFNAEKTKRLMFGNIICISQDGFQTMTIASVCNREELHEKRLGMKIEAEGGNYDNVKWNEPLTLIESKAYFVAYMHTLKALQKMERVPLEDFIVFAKNLSRPPTYLKRFDTYDFSVLDPSSELTAKALLQKINSFALKQPSELEIKQPSELQEVCLLDGLNSWPSASSLKLDESQRRALHSAITRQLSIIQGPPGTGKTYVGLQIIKLLLHNKNVWKSSSKDGKSPILVVCYTNHALDQFLEGIASFTNSIIRIGSRSKNETVRQFQISSFIRRRNFESDIARTVSTGFYNSLNNMSRLKSEIAGVNHFLKRLNEVGIIALSLLQDHISLPSNFQKLKKVTLNDYLIWGSCHENGEVPLGNSNFHSEITPLKANKQLPGANAVEEEENGGGSPDERSIDEEIFRDLENARILDDRDLLEDDEVMIHDDAEISVHTKVFDFNEQNIRNYMNELRIMISEDPYHRKSRKYIEKYNIMETELQVVKNGLAVKGNKVECVALENVPDFNKLSLPQRWKLYNYWKEKLIHVLQAIKQNKEKEFMSAAQDLESLRKIEYLGVMREVSIVGMTTTAAAQYCDVLHDLAPPIVLVEEAAEMLESHVVTSLSPNCQHLILIGDHQQLQPNPSVYRLAVEYNLNVSLFERLIRNGVSYETLEYQHRMKPCISELLVPTIYKQLQDHPSVLHYPKIRGIQKDLFFFDHTYLESKNQDDNDSVENEFEAEFAVGLCRHLLFQGYNKGDITILTPYSGQHRLIKEKQRDCPHTDGVRVSVLDNYQGEECNIIILSLVRSNEDDKVGFVKIDNRVCVSLSRAKHGFYIIGNMTQFARASPLWSQIKEKLVNGGNIGNEMTLVCENHPDKLMKVQSAQDFLLKSPEGGCIKKCSTPLPLCNHLCQRLCHVMDSDHSLVECKLPCSKILCELGHVCPKLCSQKCSPCQVLVEKVLPCTHSHKIPCKVAPGSYDCPTEVERELPDCKHKLKMKCYENVGKVRCDKNCDTRLDCGHQCKKKCHVKDDADHEFYDCHEDCDRSPENCEFFHTCKKRCFQECGPCSVLMKRKLKCGHTMSNVPCGVLPDKCQQKCRKSLPCTHYCQKLCFEDCGGCKVKVSKTIPGCQHVVRMECGITPSSHLCTSCCPKLLACGHPCRNKCGEPCTTSCQELVKSAIKCPRDHNVLLPCSVVSSSVVNASNDDELFWENCASKCGKTLECGHVCKGTCGHCYNGRLHDKCNEPCKKTLVCGHICKAPCSSTCPPCQESCDMKCIHSSCKKNCGVPCIGCKAPCTRHCKHSKCSKKCGDLCDWKGCNFPCPEVLPCSHPCIGYCGERCPKLCRVCDKEEVTQIFFGDEDEEDERFIVLEDCGHVFEAGGVDRWMSDYGNEIGMKKCPKCNVAIYNTKRFQFYIVAALEDVKKVKNKFFSLKPVIHKKDLLLGLKSLHSGSWRKDVLNLLQNIGYTTTYELKRKQPVISDMEFSLYAFQIDFLKTATQVETELKKNKNNHFSSAMGSAKDYNLEQKLNDLVKKMMNIQTCISDQMRDEAVCELRRLAVMPSIKDLYEKRNNNAGVQKILADITVIMNSSIKFSSDTERKVIDYLKEAEKYIGSLGITDHERIMIVRAMGFKQGHWYKCPNGHVYTIGECGGAVVESVCPECKASIGGSQHRLRSDNAVATEMDGATRPAYYPY